MRPRFCPNKDESKFQEMNFLNVRINVGKAEYHWQINEKGTLQIKKIVKG